MTKIKMNSKKIVLACLVLVVALGGAIYVVTSRDTPKTSDEIIGTGKLNTSPATKEDLKRADDNKQRIVERDQALNDSSGQQPKATAQPVITYSGQYGQNVEVGAQVNGVFEDGGKCTATFIQGNEKVTKSVDAVKDVRSVACPVMSVPSSDFRVKGTWQVTVSYSSTSASGTSGSKQLEIR